MLGTIFSKLFKKVNLKKFKKLAIVNQPMTIANYITFTRIFISPIFLLIYLQYEALGISLQSMPFVLLGLLALSELSDLIDGFLARRLGEVTELGKVLDPMADSIWRLSVFLTFTLEPINLPMILIFVLLYRDSCISTLRTVCALRGFALAARPSGKIKAVVQGIAAFIVTLLLIPYSKGSLSEQDLQSFSFWIVLAAAIYTVISGIEYFISNRSYIKQALSRRPS